ncbi:MAG TPA: alginate lyase family protein [Cytophagales bacterium]|nr:alginate lyase family protein [Cytophagales bacterium]
MSSVRLITLEQWRKDAKPFFFQGREVLGSFMLSTQAKESLKEDYKNILEGKIQYFNNKWINVGLPYNWHHNPDSNYEYPKDVHWAYIPDLATENGDIKYVWEKSRFSFLYTVIRHDQHLGTDSSTFVFGLISDWIIKNPLNQGPNYKCSQEISLRLLNWTFALYYYKNSNLLTEELFAQTLNSMRQQLIHVYKNIHFSRLTVRNNHAITETLALYLISVLFPSIPEATKYMQQGKHWFEEEIAYQIYGDGSYLQFSMNYHRVVVQLLTWAVELSKLNRIDLSITTLQKAKITTNFLYQHQDEHTGRLPNYGANDGALFFKLSQESFLNYRPQINALYCVLENEHLYTPADHHEDAWWFKGGKLNIDHVKPIQKVSLFRADEGGFYVMRSKTHFAMIRCGKHKDRPQQADQNHLDLWYKGQNIVRDNGSYKYNTDPNTVNYFSGTASHNTLQISDLNQMLKGGRFIWYYWSQSEKVETENTPLYISLSAIAQVYRYISEDIRHHRRVKQYQEEARWDVTDTFLCSNTLNGPFKQTWHLSDDFYELGFEIRCFDRAGNELLGQRLEAWHSPVYGEKQASSAIQFTSDEPYFSTTISKNTNLP